MYIYIQFFFLMLWGISGETSVGCSVFVPYVFPWKQTKLFAMRGISIVCVYKQEYEYIIYKYVKIYVTLV